MPAVDVADALRRAAAVGPYFAVDLDAPPDPRWLPLDALTDGSGLLAARVAAVRGALAARAGVGAAEVELRAGASIDLLGLASRLLAPALAAAVLAGVVPLTDRVRWQPVGSGPVPLSFDEVRGRTVSDAAAAGTALLDAVVLPVVMPLVRAFRRDAGVSPIVLRGDVASALAGAAGVLERSGAPMRLDPVAVAAAALAGPLSGTGAFGADGRFFRRTSCCLFYRLPGAGLCGDCVLG